MSLYPSSSAAAANPSSSASQAMLPSAQSKGVLQRLADAVSSRGGGRYTSVEQVDATNVSGELRIAAGCFRSHFFVVIGSRR